MADIIYSVALNGTGVVWEHKVVYETPKRYIIDRTVSKYINKETMCDRWEMYFTDIVEAREFYHQNRNRIEKACKVLDINYVYKMLKTIQAEELVTDKLDMIIEYVERYL